VDPQPGEELLVLGGLLRQGRAAVHHSGDLAEVGEVAVEVGPVIFTIDFKVYDMTMSCHVSFICLFPR